MKSRSTTHVLLIAVGLCLLAPGLAISRGGSLNELGQLALGLALLVPAALAGGNFAARFGQPPVLGELLAGMLLGNLPGLQVLRSLGSDSYLDILSQVGMLLLLFEVGLGLSVRDLSAVGPSSFVVALIGTVASVVMGTLVAYFFMPAAPTAAHLFLGAAIAATSVGITARVLRDMNVSRNREAKIILGAAVVDDVLALVVLGAVTAWVAPAARRHHPGGVDRRARDEDHWLSRPRRLTRHLADAALVPAGCEAAHTWGSARRRSVLLLRAGVGGQRHRTGPARRGLRGRPRA